MIQFTTTTAIVLILQAMLYFVLQRSEVFCSKAPKHQHPRKISSTKASTLFDPAMLYFPGGGGAAAAAKDAARFTEATTTTTKYYRTTPGWISFKMSCDTYAFECLRSMKTGPVCARTMYYHYKNFTTYCFVDFVNCMYRYQLWQIVNMGHCRPPEPKHKGIPFYNYEDDSWLDQDYILDES